MHGKGLIQFASIIFIISGIAAIIVYPIGTLFFSWATVESAETLGWALVAICLLYAVSGLIQLIAGCKGVKGCHSAEASARLRGWGIAVLLIALVSAGFDFVNSMIQGTSILLDLLGVVLSLIFPILYLCGVSRNTRS